jgi:hypothetical protein
VGKVSRQQATLMLETAPEAAAWVGAVGVQRGSLSRSRDPSMVQWVATPPLQRYVYEHYCSTTLKN